MFDKQKKLPSSEYFRRIAPLAEELRVRKNSFDIDLKNNFLSRERFVVICGPCSADEPDAMKEYVSKLSSLSARCKSLLTVARIYTAKPHSNGSGYLGTCFNLNENESADLEKGIIRCRQMMINCIENNLPVADELLYPELYDYFSDLVSYWFIGARSGEDSLHRAFASGLDVCCGVKNGTDGDLYKAVDSLRAISNPNVFPFNGYQIETNGCRYAHVVLRGGVSYARGETAYFSNIDSNSVSRIKTLLKTRGLNDFIIADLNHANSGKVAKRQIENVKEVVNNTSINGVMLESYLFEGEKSTEYGVSRTDGCLSIEDTELVFGYLQRFLSEREKQ